MAERSKRLVGVAGVVMALCCLAGPAVLGAAAGAGERQRARHRGRGRRRGGRRGVAVALAHPNRQGLMQPRVMLVLLLVAATALFVVGVSIEKSSGDTYDEASAAATEQGGGAETGDEHAGESGEAAESGRAAQSGEAGETAEGHIEPAAGKASEEDETLVGIDLEATGFVALAAAVSLAVALAVWLRPGWALLLAVVVVVMVAFAALDVREVFHQVDEDDGGLALLAGVVAALHLATAAGALLMRRASLSSAGGAVA